MKQEQIQSRAHYQAPALKLFQITLEGGCCQAVSPFGMPPIPYPGTGLGDDDLG